jgi:2-amino-4-hydroxy-6-hydroxymethyldihydropteridine diphosphokinase
MAVIAFVSLGSNQGDRRGYLCAALDGLRATPGVRVVEVSPVYETDAVGPGLQRPHLNAVACLSTTLSARALLERLLAIEAEQGRVRGAVRHMPRTLDLDLLLYAERVIDEPGLSVPHPSMLARPFVLEPLCDLAAELVHPVAGETIAVLAARVRDTSAVRPYEP